MIRYGLIGEHLQHSYSPRIHSMLGCHEYALIELQKNELPEFMNKKSFLGINVTIPYKKAVIPFLDALMPTAAQIQSVNTIVKDENGRLIGANTDYNGFDYLLQRSNLQVKDQKVLVLGNGGAAATVRCVLENHGAQHITISRSGENNYSNLELHADATVIVNTTPVGMYPKNGESPVNLGIFSHLKGVIDLIYNPSNTKLMLDAKAKGLVAIGGLDMLVAQAKYASDLFFQKNRSDQIIRSISETIALETRNIVLIGMPGCGKTTIGRQLGIELNRPFYDCDEEFEKKYGYSPEYTIKAFKEEKFRKLETDLVQELGKLSGSIIATGGGVVTRRENYDFLKQNATIIYLNRSIKNLSIEHRPLSQQIGLKKLYIQREPLYRAWAEHTVDITDELDINVNRIRTVLGL